MKIGPTGRIISAIVFVAGIVCSIISGADYWQAIVAGSLFGIWALFLNAD